jgi:hypothetical protein
LVRSPREKGVAFLCSHKGRKVFTPHYPTTTISHKAYILEQLTSVFLRGVDGPELAQLAQLRLGLARAVVMGFLFKAFFEIIEVFL